MAMTIDEVNAAVAEIRKVARNGDDERAHSLEDRLFRQVLRAVEELGGPAAELATAALATRELGFSRWCA